MKKYYSVATIAKRNARIFVQISNAKSLSKNYCLADIKSIWIVVKRLKMPTASVNAHSSLVVGISANESVEIAKKLVMVLASRNVIED